MHKMLLPILMVKFHCKFQGIFFFKVYYYKPFNLDDNHMRHIFRYLTCKECHVLIMITREEKMKLSIIMMKRNPLIDIYHNYQTSHYVSTMKNGNISINWFEST